MNTIRKQIWKGGKIIRFFEGCYFKCSTQDETFSLIPAINGKGKNKKASLQVITENEVFNIPLQDMRFDRKRFRIKAGENLFSLKGIKLNIHTDQVQIAGRIKFMDIKKIKYPIMGPFRYVPFMQCRHSIYSMFHKINGCMNINEKQYIFHSGTGYIEGDKGYSFPSRYAWTQCHYDGISLMLSVAEIPMPGFHFTGVIGVINIYGYEYRLATYLGAKLMFIDDDIVIVKQGSYWFRARLIKNSGLPLYAPQDGEMTRIIHESVKCTVGYRFEWKDKVMFDFQSNMASFELEY